MKNKISNVFLAYSNHEIKHSHSPLVGKEVHPSQKRMVEYFNQANIFFIPYEEFENSIVHLH